MTWLVADVGGTNTRFAVAHAGGLIEGSEQAFANNGFPSFEAVLDAYLAAEQAGGIAGACIAIAGPVMAGQARLTNRDWIFDPVRIASRLGGKPVRLTNDLVALGLSLPALSAGQLHRISALPPKDARRNGQTLVVGMGTGFNVCLVRAEGNGSVPIVMEAELGHAGLSQALAAALGHALGEPGDTFRTLEDCFSGRGFARLHSALGDQSAPFMARLMGVIAADLVAAYMPLNGLIYAGGVARAVLGSSACQIFIDSFADNGTLGQVHRDIPVSVIVDDRAGLYGCLALTPEARGNQKS